MITQVLRIYDKRPDVFKYVAISDDFRESPWNVLECPKLPATESDIQSDDGRLFRVLGRHAARTGHPLIWEVSLEVAEMEFTPPKFYGSIGSLVTSRSTSPVTV